MAEGTCMESVILIKRSLGVFFHVRVRTCRKVFILLTFTNEITNGVKG